MRGRTPIERNAVEWEPSLDRTLPRAWQRVWRDGRDITTEPIETWRWPFSRYYREGWRPVLYPGEVVEWPNPGRLPAEPYRGGARAGRGSRRG